jgi:pimeloyl-ACP methyl ester carboxylesterase
VGLNHHRLGEGPPLLLLHGIGSQWRVFGPVLERLARERDVVAVDLPGFGASAPDDAAPTVENLAGAVQAFAGELGLERPHVAGSSMGGGIALELARRGAVASVTAVSPIGFWTDRERRWCQKSLRRSRRLVQVLAPAMPAILDTAAGRTLALGQYFGRAWKLTGEQALEVVRSVSAATAFDAALEQFSNHRFHDPDELRRVPVTVAWGDRDYLLLYRQSRRAQRMLPWGRHVTLAGCGHVPFSDDPALLADVLLAGSAAG